MAGKGNVLYQNVISKLGRLLYPRADMNDMAIHTSTLNIPHNDYSRFCVFFFDFLTFSKKKDVVADPWIWFVPSSQLNLDP